MQQNERYRAHDKHRLRVKALKRTLHIVPDIQPPRVAVVSAIFTVDGETYLYKTLERKDS